MFRTLLLPASLGLAAIGALIPATALAQNYDGWSAQQYSGGGHGYRDRGNDVRDDRDHYQDRGGYESRQRWIQHKRWEQQARRRHWQHEQWRHGDDRRNGGEGDYGRWHHRDDDDNN